MSDLQRLINERNRISATIQTLDIDLKKAKRQEKQEMIAKKHELERTKKEIVEKIDKIKKQSEKRESEQYLIENRAFLRTRRFAPSFGSSNPQQSLALNEAGEIEFCGLHHTKYRIEDIPLNALKSIIQGATTRLFVACNKKHPPKGKAVGYTLQFEFQKDLARQHQQNTAKTEPLGEIRKIFNVFRGH